MSAILVHEEVQEVLAAGGPVVALESSILAHGLPHPLNLEVGEEMEAAVRAAGAIPAMIAVIGGRIRVGLQRAERERLASAGATGAGPGALKCAAADLAAAMAAGADGGTTVSATAWVAARVGIHLFATGGIGGVHRGDARDVSSDIGTMAAVPVAVVASGAKMVLDLPRTLEALETAGVLVLGYRTAEFPGFYCRQSGLRLHHHASRPGTVAELLELRFGALRQGGVLICQPVPEEGALPAARVEQVVQEALRAADQAGIRGKELTPYLLRMLAENSGGETLRANRLLAVCNARLAGEIAVSYSERSAT